MIEKDKIRVLLVDDDEDDYMLTKYIFDEFKDNSYELEWTMNYDVALKDMTETAHDIYLVDYRLGAHNGLDLLQKAISGGCRSPIILLTGQGDKEVDFMAMQAGAADYLVKGEFEAPLLERAIRYSLRHAQSMERLLHEALHDSLTGLPNRTKFSEVLSDALKKAKRIRTARFAVLFLDLDRFKVINDSLGHLIGDKLLVETSRRLQSCLRPYDVVARFGGDEFVIFICDAENVEVVLEISERLQREISAPFKIDGHEIFTSTSIGITLYDDSYDLPEDILRDADSAMYQAKTEGKARCKVFQKSMHASNVNLLQVENDLRRAIERNEFRVYYQPIVDLRNRTITEFESLIRWEHPENGLIAPCDFIPLAEETGLIIPMGRWVLEESCRQIKIWEEKLFSSSHLSISVNLSAKQLMNSEVIHNVQEIMKRTGIKAHTLKLEITESMIMDNAELALQILSDLCELGVRISSDDFGTGYSSLSYIHKFPFHRLKIDRSFISKMDRDEKSEEIVRTIILLAKIWEWIRCRRN
ncbi:MAG: EAL domain-containing protein [Blastocatellia bacterium]|nr:EAL domain-containing protein [Blastocatellia bacterium]